MVVAKGKGVWGVWWQQKPSNFPMPIFQFFVFHVFPDLIVTPDFSDVPIFPDNISSKKFRIFSRTPIVSYVLIFSIFHVFHFFPDLLGTPEFFGCAMFPDNIFASYLYAKVN